MRWDQTGKIGQSDEESVPSSEIDEEGHTIAWEDT